MMPASNVWLLSLALVAVQSAISLPLNPGTSAPGHSSSDMISFENEYLRYLFQTIEDSGKQPNENGEMNLLPEGSKKFANMVQCLAEDREESASVSGSHRRTLTYNPTSNMISDTQKPVAFRLVVPTCMDKSNCQEYTLNVYNTNQQSKPEATALFKGTEKYIDLEVELIIQLNIEQATKYQLILEIVSPDNSLTDDELATILKSLKPMLIIYSYDDFLIKNLFQTPDTATVVKRDVQTVQPSLIIESAGPTLEERRQNFCQVHTVNLTSYESWLSPNYEVLNPPNPSMSFCVGHCRLEDIENAERITTHAKNIGVMDPRLIEAGVTPCCIPTQYRLTNLEFRPKNSVNIGMTVIQNHVTECGCY